MLGSVKFVSNLLQLILVLLLYARGNVANEINYGRQQSLSSIEDQVTVLQYSQQQQQLKRYNQESVQMNTAPKQPIYWPMVKFLKSAPIQPPSTPQQLTSNDNNLHLSNVYHISNQQYNTFNRQQQPTMVLLRVGQLQPKRLQQYHLQQQQSYNTYQPQNLQNLTKFNQQQQINQKYELPLTSLSSEQLIKNSQQQHLQGNNFEQLQQQQQQQQQQQVFNFAPIVRLNQQRYQQQYQMHQPQQSPQLQKQHLQFYKPQMTTTTTTKTTLQQLQIRSPQPNSYYQFQQQQQHQPPFLNFNKQQMSPNFSPMVANSRDLAISPLLPSYLDDDDDSTVFNYAQTCQMCCIEGRNPCERCCDTRPLLSATLLKSSAG